MMGGWQLWLVVACAAASATARAAPDFVRDVKPILARRCFGCHSGSHAPNLSAVRDEADVRTDYAVWATVVRRLRDGEMPPTTVTARPTAAEQQQVVAWFDDLSKRIAAAPTVGRTVPRRLSRKEYALTMQSLFGYTPTAASMPEDDRARGFPNVASALYMDSVRAEEYLGHAEAALDRAFGVSSGAVVLTDEQVTGGVYSEADRAWRFNGVFSMTTSVDVATPGFYTIEVQAYAEQAGPALAKVSFAVDGVVVSSQDVRATRGPGERLSVAVPIDAGLHSFGVGFPNDYWDPGNPDPAQRDRNLLVAAWSYLPPARDNDLYRRLMVCEPSGPDDQACLEQILAAALPRFFRRPVGPEELGRYLTLANRAPAAADAEAKVRQALTAALIAPAFLYRAPSSSDEMPAEMLADYQLATDLSYLLWSSPPDDQLRSAAVAGQLRNPAGREVQVRRLLADARADTGFFAEFFGSFLGLQGVEQIVPDAVEYPTFALALRRRFQDESLAYARHVATMDWPLAKLVDADVTMVDRTLAAHYGITGAYSDVLTPVVTDGSRGGILRQGGFLLVTSDPRRPSTVRRGRWVLEHLLCDQPADPPPGIPTLPPEAPPGATARDLLAAHRGDPTCASCHVKMDPIGLALETFDVVGRARSVDNGSVIDPSGTLPGGRTFADAAGLISLIGADPELAPCFERQLFLFGTGRDPQGDDLAVVRTAVGAAPTITEAILHMIESPSFLPTALGSP